MAPHLGWLVGILLLAFAMFFAVEPHITGRVTLEPSKVTTYASANGATAWFSSLGSTSFQHNDYLGSTRLLTRESGVKSASLFSAPFGENIERSEASDASSRFQFTGKEQDNSRLQYFGARYYDAPTGRFVSADPLPRSDESSYAYVNDDPLSFSDPSGKVPEEQSSEISMAQMENPSTPPSISCACSVCGECRMDNLERRANQASQMNPGMRRGLLIYLTPIWLSTPGMMAAPTAGGLKGSIFGSRVAEMKSMARKGMKADDPLQGLSFAAELSTKAPSESQRGVIATFEAGKLVRAEGFSLFTQSNTYQGFHKFLDIAKAPPGEKIGLQLINADPDVLMARPQFRAGPGFDTEQALPQFQMVFQEMASRGLVKPIEMTMMNRNGNYDRTVFNPRTGNMYTIPQVTND